MLITGHATSAAAFVASDAISGFVQDIFTLMLRGTGPPIALLLHFLNWPRAHGKAEVWRLTRTLSVVPLTRAILEADVWTEELANARTVIIEASSAACPLIVDRADNPCRNGKRFGQSSRCCHRC